MRVIIYEKDGVVHRITPAPNMDIKDAKKDIPEGVTFKVVNNNSLPDITKRHQWRLEGDSVVIDPSKIDITIETEWIDNELKDVRDKIEEKLDAGLKATRLRTYRQALKEYKSNLYMPNVSRPTL